MKKCLIVTEGYYSGRCANALCIKNIAKSFNDSDLKADILSAEDTDFADNEFCIRHFECRGIIYKCIKKITRLATYPVRDKKLSRDIRVKVAGLMKKHNYDAIIAVVNPTESADAISGLKKEFPNTKFLLYEIDPYSCRFKYPKNFLEKWLTALSKRWEKKVYKEMDIIIHMKTHTKHFLEHNYKKYAEKTVFLDIPNFVRNDVFFENNENAECCKFIYTGAFYPDLRNPKTMMEILDKLYLKEKFEMHVYTGKDMAYMIKDCEYVKIHNEIPHDDMMKKLYAADIFVSLGNYKSDYLPSKIFTYMSVGKPIIHFYQNGDSSISYLKKYTRALLINQDDDIEINADRIAAFLGKYSQIPIDRETLYRDLAENTPEFTAKQFATMIGEKNEIGSKI